ncbi:hypothetical protein FRB95_000875 [Tulasnella sp. JGI-2019a]|nr:hypothetical protein FRB95_000875 [Tulasnella sp. JGI-2019a]
MLPGQIAWHWGNLQQALIERFVLVSKGAAEGSTSSLVSTEIVQPRILPMTGGLKAFVTEPARFGLIQVHAAELTVPTYISSPSSSSGRLYLTQHTTEALRIRFFPSAHLHNIQVVQVCSIISLFGQHQQNRTIFQPDRAIAPILDHLGVTRFFNDSSSNIGADERFYLTYTDRSQKSTRWQGTCGPTKAAIWMISDKNVVRASWDYIDLIPFVGIAKLTRYDPRGFSTGGEQVKHPIITMAIDEAEFLARFQGDNPKYVKAEMTFSALDRHYDQVNCRSQDNQYADSFAWYADC